MTTPRSCTVAFAVDRTAQEVFDAINDVRRWWSEGVVRATDRVGGEFRDHYRDVHRCTLRVTGLLPGRRVAWLVVDDHFDFVEDQAEWKGTEIVFDISDTDAGADVRSTHVGLVPRFECYDVCSTAWHGYVAGSLRSLVLTGQGQPDPGEGGDAPAHQDRATTHRSKRSPA